MTARHAASRFTAFSFTLILALTLGGFAALLAPVPAQAELTTNVDDRVKVKFSRTRFDRRERLFRTWVKVINVSNAPITPPLRIVITEFKNPRIVLANPDGVESGGNAYVDINLRGAVLEAGERSEWTLLKFRKLKRKSDDDDDDDDDDDARDDDDDDDRWSWRDDDDDDDDDRHRHNWRTKLKKVAQHIHEHKQRHRRWRHHRSPIKFNFEILGGSEVELGKPSSVPFALVPGAGPTPVTFNVSAVTEGPVYTGNVFLQGPGLPSGAPMDDSDGNGIFTVQPLVDASGLGGGDCLAYTATTTLDDGSVVTSPVYNLCATNFPQTVSESDTSPDNLVVIAQTPAVGDEVLVSFAAGTPDSEVEALAQSLGAQVVGTLLPQGLYQLRLPAVQSPGELQQLIDQANAFPGVTGAGANHVGVYTSIPSDTDFALQHGLQLVSADNLGAPTPKYVWDANGTGSGITVLVLDSGVDAAHPDLAPLPGDNTDALGHGTEMGGIVAATTDNALGVAGLARAASIRSIEVSADAAVTEAEMLSGLTAALPLANASTIVNASFSIYPLIFPTVNMCRAIDDLIVAGAVVVNSAGNDGVSSDNVWPGNCNTPNPALQAALGANVVADPNKPSFIVVAASNCSAGPCAADSIKPDSNRGNWVDIAAPGVDVRTTNTGGGYIDSNGTSAAAALTSGAAAILRSCGVANTSVFSVLDLGATVTVTPDFNRVNLYNSLETENTSPTGVNLSSNTVDENTDTSGGFVIGTLSANDTTVCDAHTFTIAGADAASFLPVGTSNQLELNAGVLDFEAKSSYNITVQATDFFGLSTAAVPLAINVVDVDEPPTIAPQVRNIDENEPNGTNVGAPIAASDEDAGASLAFAITGGNTGGAFAINAAGQITVANSAALDFETNPVFNLTVEVTDNGDAPPLSSSATVTVNLNDLPEASILLASCGTDNTSGDLIFRGFFHPSYPGTSLDTVELFISSRQAGSHTIRLDARANAYDGALIASNSQTRTLSGVDTDNVSYLFDMGNASVTSGSVVAFSLTLESGPPPGPSGNEVFFAVDATNHPLGVPDPTPSCDLDETTDTTPPLSTFRRDGLWIRIMGQP